jgi:simple sugar transport system ATP-binding protein
MIGRFRVVAPGADAPTAVLSGGNIQKVLVARALAIAGQGGDSVLVAMNPTSGLDVGAAAFVHGQLGAMCSRGAGVLLISEDLEELLAICHRILVLYRGQIVGSYEREAFDRYEIGAGMVGSGD